MLTIWRYITQGSTEFWCWVEDDIWSFIWGRCCCFLIIFRLFFNTSYNLSNLVCERQREITVTMFLSRQEKCMWVNEKIDIFIILVALVPPPLFSFLLSFFFLSFFNPKWMKLVQWWFNRSLWGEGGQLLLSGPFLFCICPTIGFATVFVYIAHYVVYTCGTTVQNLHGICTYHNCAWVGKKKMAKISPSLHQVKCHTTAHSTIRISIDGIWFRRSIFLPK